MSGAREWTVEARAMARGLPTERFRLWRGRSGRRYVFSRIDDLYGLDDLDEAVVMTGRAGADGGFLVDRLVANGWELPRGWPAGREVFAHLLAETSEMRADVVADLGEGVIGRA